MSDTLTLPDLDEVRSLDRMMLVARLRMGLERIDPRIFEMEPESLDRPWDAADGVGTMSCRALLAHLMDAELVYSYRIRRTLAEDGPVLDNFDEHAFMASPMYGVPKADGANVRVPMGAMAASIHALRQTLGALLYQIDETDWDRRAMHPERGPVTVHELVCTHTWHVYHHAVFLNAKAEKLLGPRPKGGGCGDAAQNGGCGSGCGCVGAGSDAEQQA
ncbi:MAG: DinB family protein [Planctomycetota bacterium]